MSANGVSDAQFIGTTMIALTAGTMFLLWLGEQITEKGVGNGISFIIFAGIVASLPGQMTLVRRCAKRATSIRSAS